MPCCDGGNSADKRVERANERKQQCKRTEYVQAASVSPLLRRGGPKLYVLPAGVEFAGRGASPGAASYFEAHFACTCSATNFPSGPSLPSISAWELSTNESGSGSFPV